MLTRPRTRCFKQREAREARQPRQLPWQPYHIHALVILICSRVAGYGGCGGVLLEPMVLVSGSLEERQGDSYGGAVLVC